MPVFPDAAAVAQAAAELFVQVSQRAIADHGRFTVALSGGSTPKRLHALLASDPLRDQVEWERVVVLFGDDRYVPPSDPQSNETMARDTLLTLVPVAEENIHAPYREGGPEIAARDYELVVRRLFGDEPPSLDLTILGMGGDGHTASLFPGEPVVYEKEHLVVASRAPVNAPERVTMTPPLLNASRTVLFLVTGEDKAEAVHRCLEGEENWDETPSQAIARYAPNVVWMLDEAAASRLTSRP